jgi:transcriptional regulator with XRE-family HTH domain
MSLAFAPAPDPAATVRKALFRAAEAFGIAQAELGAVIGLSPASMSRLARGEGRLSGKTLELSLLFLRLFRSLDAIVGGDDRAARSWLRSSNTALDGAVPLQLIQTIPGLMDAVSYVDARRAVV